MPWTPRDPLIRPVSVFTRGIDTPSGNAQASGPGPVRITSGGQLFDGRNPQQAARNALAEGANFREFLSFLNEDLAPKFLGAVNEGRSLAQAAEFRNNPAVQEIFKSGDPKARWLTLGWDEAVKDSFGEYMASQVANEAVADLQIEYKRNPLLNGDDRSALVSDDPRPLTEAMIQARPTEKLQQLTNLSQQFPKAQRFLAEFQRAEQTLKLGVRDLGVKVRRDQALEGVNGLLGESSRRLSEQAGEIETFGSVAPAQSLEARKEVDRLGKLQWEAVVDAGERTGLGPDAILRQNIVTRLASLDRLKQQARNAAASGQAFDYQGLLEATSELGIWVSAAKQGNSTVLSETNDAGIPLSEVIQNFEAEIIGAQLELQEASSVQEGARWDLEAYLGDGTLTEITEQMMPVVQSFVDRGDFVGAKRIVDAARSGFASRMQMDEAQRTYYINKAVDEVMVDIVRSGGEPTTEHFAKLAKAGAYETYQQLRGQQEARQERLGKERSAEITRWLREGTYMQQTLVEQDLRWLDQKVTAGQASGQYQEGTRWMGDPDTNPQLRAEREKEYRASVEGILRRKVTDALDSGKLRDFSDGAALEQLVVEARSEAKENMLQGVPKASEAQKRRAAGDYTKPEDMQAQAISTLLSSVEKRGRLDQWAFPEDIRRRATRQSGTFDTRKALRLMADRIDAVLRKDGKLTIDGKDVPNTYNFLDRQIQERVKPKKVSSAPIPAELLPVANKALQGLQQLGAGVGESFLAMLTGPSAQAATLASAEPVQGVVETQTAPGPTAPPANPAEPMRPDTQPKDVSTQELPPPVTQGFGRLLLDAAGVPKEQPTPEGPVPLTVEPHANTPEGQARLSRILNGSERMKADTPPLPQAPADAPAEDLPLAVTNPRHPWIYRMVLSRQVAEARRGGKSPFAPGVPQWMRDSSNPRVGFMGGGGGGAVEVPENGVRYDDDRGQGGFDVFMTSQRVPNLLPGVVKEVGYQGSGNGSSGRGYGNFVVVESIDPKTGQKVDVLYGHLGTAPGQGINVREGQTISPGQIIGQQGNTGRVIGAPSIMSVDFLAPAPKGSGSQTPYSRFLQLRKEVGDGLLAGRLLGGQARPQQRRSGGGNDVPFRLRDGMDMLGRMGFPTKGAAFLAGNIQQESSWAGLRTWDDVGAIAGGLVSWRAGRLRKIEQKYLGMPITQASMVRQLQAMHKEMEMEYPAAYRVFMDPNATEAELRQASYEYWGYGDEGKRYEYARQLLQ